MKNYKISLGVFFFFFFASSRLPAAGPTPTDQHRGPHPQLKSRPQAPRRHSNPVRPMRVGSAPLIRPQKSADPTRRRSATKRTVSSTSSPISGSLR